MVFFEVLQNQYQSSSSRHSLALHYHSVSVHQGWPHVVHHQRSGEVGVIATAIPVGQGEVGRNSEGEGVLRVTSNGIDKHSFTL